MRVTGISAHFYSNADSRQSRILLRPEHGPSRYSTGQQAARRCFEWFLGRNDLGQSLYDSSTGGCRDALHPDRVNQNQGAESTLVFQLALAEMTRAEAVFIREAEAHAKRKHAGAPRPQAVGAMT